MAAVVPSVTARAVTHPLVLLARVVAAPQRIAGGGKPDQARLRTDAHGCTWTHLWAEAHAARRRAACSVASTCVVARAMANARQLWRRGGRLFC